MRRLLIGFCLLFPVHASAAIWGGSPDATDWEFVFTPVLHPSDLKADVKVNGQAQTFKRANPTDWVTFGTRMRLEAWKGKFGVLGNLHYLSLWDESRLDSATTVELNGSYWGLETAGSYRFLQTDFNTAVPTDLGLEVYAGVRASFLDIDLDFEPGADQSDNKNWVEPMIGERIVYGVGERWNFVVKGDIGGFGLGSASKITWDFAPEIIFKLGDGIYLNGGYEIFDLKTENVGGSNENELTARLQGPTLGLTFHFSTEGSSEDYP